LNCVSAGSSSIFGGAKPVDTAAREKEIEDRMLKDKQAQKERKEVENQE
jgi:translation initiation factor 4B